MVTLYTDIDECSRGLDDCDSNADCINNEGSFECVCPDEFIGDGRECLMTQLNQDECEDGTNECSPDAECTDLDEGYRCSCNNGYTGDGNTCTGQPKMIQATVHNFISV